MITTYLGTDSASLHTAANALKTGELVAFPTETVYGLGANAYNDDAVKEIFAVKQRPADNPLIVHVAGKHDLEHIAFIESTLEERLIETFTPGPFSIVLSSRQNLAPSVSPNQTTVCVRIPDHPTAQQLLCYTKVPIAAPSANRSGRPSPTTATMVYQDLTGCIPFIIDGGPSVYGIESTVVKVEHGIVHILRPGFITVEDIETALGTDIPVRFSSKAHHTLQTPGARYPHYAPKQPVYITADPVTDITVYLQTYPHTSVAFMVTQETYQHIRSHTGIFKELVEIYLRGSQQQLSSCAARLYSLYHTIEKTEAAAIFVEALPETGIGYSIMNRVKKSASL